MTTKKKGSSNDELLKGLMDVVGSLATSVKELSEEVKVMKETQSSPKQEEQAPSALRDDVLRTLEYRRDNHKVQSYKVMAYTEDGISPDGKPRKNYKIPGYTFNSLKKAKEYVAKNPERKFDIIPL